MSDVPGLGPRPGWDPPVLPPRPSWTPPNKPLPPKPEHGPTDADGFTWVRPSPTSDPPRPRTRVVGYNYETKTVRCIFRDGTPWRYDNVSPEEWDAMIRLGSVGKYINKVLNGKPYGRGDFGWPGLPERPSEPPPS